jgi:hypothetical protein
MKLSAAVTFATVAIASALSARTTRYPFALSRLPPAHLPVRKTETPTLVAKPKPTEAPVPPLVLWTKIPTVITTTATAAASSTATSTSSAAILDERGDPLVFGCDVYNNTGCADGFMCFAASDCDWGIKNCPGVCMSMSMSK